MFGNGYSHRFSLVTVMGTGSIARSATRRHLSYPEADFEVFAPHGRHVARLARSSPPPCQISPPSVQKGRIPRAILKKFAEFLPRFRMH